MTDRQKELVKSTFKAVAPIADVAADLFYNRLFEVYPHYRSLFKGDMKLQGRMLMQMLATAVGGLDTIDRLLPALRDLGRRHVHYGVTEQDYGAVGGTLLWTLEKGLGDKWNNEVKDAWIAAYQLLSSVMIDAAKETEAIFISQETNIAV